MEKRILIAILGFGLLLAVVSLLMLLLPKDLVKQNIRYIAPLPPLAVAVYVYILQAADVFVGQRIHFVYDLFKMAFWVSILFFVFGFFLDVFINFFSK